METYRFNPSWATTAAESMIHRNALNIDGILVKRSTSKTLYAFPTGTMTCASCHTLVRLGHQTGHAIFDVDTCDLCYDGLVCDDCTERLELVHPRHSHVLFGIYYIPDARPLLELQCILKRWLASARRRIARKRAAKVIIRAMRRWVGISRMMNPDTLEGNTHMHIMARKWYTRDQKKPANIP